MFKDQPIICKLADFGESRSAINQTNNVCRMVTSNIVRGTPAYRAPELFRQNGSTLSLEDLKAVDVWALEMLFFVIINPDLKYPYQFELEKVPTGNCLSVFREVDFQKREAGLLGALLHTARNKLSPFAQIVRPIYAFSTRRQARREIHSGYP